MPRHLLFPNGRLWAPIEAEPCRAASGALEVEPSLAPPGVCRAPAIPSPRREYIILRPSPLRWGYEFSITVLNPTAAIRRRPSIPRTSTKPTRPTTPTTHQHRSLSIFFLGIEAPTHTIATAPSSSPSAKGLGFRKISRGVEEPEGREAIGVVFGMGEVTVAPVFSVPPPTGMEMDGGPDCKRNRK
jgi:hypothetical protein